MFLFSLDKLAVFYYSIRALFENWILSLCVYGVCDFFFRFLILLAPPFFQLYILLWSPVEENLFLEVLYLMCL